MGRPKKVLPEDTPEGKQVIRDEAAAEAVYAAESKASPPGKLAGYWKQLDEFGGCVWVPTGPGKKE